MDNKQPLVSVLVPCYNHEQFIKQTIESVLNQTYKFVELIVIDDGSIDQSASILAGLSEKHGFKFLRQENIGIHKTLNKLLELSQGKYISILGSDDVLVPDKIEVQVKYMEAHPEISATFGNMLQISGDGDPLPWYYQRFTKQREYNFEDILSMRAQYLYAPTAMYRKSVFDELGGYDERFLIEDLYIHLKIAHHKLRLVVLPDLLAYYRVHVGNMSKQYAVNRREKLRLLQQYKGEKGYRKGVRKTNLVYWMYSVLNILPRAINPFKS